MQGEPCGFVPSVGGAVTERDLRARQTRRFGAQQRAERRARVSTRDQSASRLSLMLERSSCFGALRVTGAEFVGEPGSPSCGAAGLADALLTSQCRFVAESAFCIASSSVMRPA